MRLSFLLLVSWLPLPLLASTQRRPRAYLPPPKAAAPAAFDPRQRPRHLSDEQLLDQVQRQPFHCFWGLGKENPGLARERSSSSFDTGPEVVTTGGTGLGLMALLVAAERKWITRE